MNHIFENVNLIRLYYCRSRKDFIKIRIDLDSRSTQIKHRLHINLILSRFLKQLFNLGTVVSNHWGGVIPVGSIAWGDLGETPPPPLSANFSSFHAVFGAK